MYEERITHQAYSVLEEVGQAIEEYEAGLG